MLRKYRIDNEQQQVPPPASVQNQLVQIDTTGMMEIPLERYALFGSGRLEVSRQRLGDRASQLQRGRDRHAARRQLLGLVLGRVRAARHGYLCSIRRRGRRHVAGVPAGRRIRLELRADRRLHELAGVADVSRRIARFAQFDPDSRRRRRPARTRRGRWRASRITRASARRTTTCRRISSSRDSRASSRAGT